MHTPLNPQADITTEENVTLNKSQPRREVNSAELLGTRDALTIRHQDEVYILRRTRAGKLILTK